MLDPAVLILNYTYVIPFLLCTVSLLWFLYCQTCLRLVQLQCNFEPLMLIFRIIVEEDGLVQRKLTTNLAITCTLDVITWQSSISAMSTLSVRRSISLISLSKCSYKISLHDADSDTLWRRMYQGDSEGGRERERVERGREKETQRVRGEGRELHVREIIPVLAVLHYSYPSPWDRRHSPCCLRWWEYSSYPC